MLQDIRYALRALRASPGFAAVAILSLALGIGANTAIFSLIDSVILKTLPVAHPEGLIQVTMGTSASFTNPIWEQVRDRQDVFSGIFAYGGGRFNLASGGEARFAQANYASGQFFGTLGVHAVLGRTFTAADDKRGCPGIAVLSHGFWEREYGGHDDVVGKSISLDNHPFEIVGVVERGFTGGRGQRKRHIRASLHGENHSWRPQFAGPAQQLVAAGDRPSQGEHFGGAGRSAPENSGSEYFRSYGAAELGR